MGPPRRPRFWTPDRRALLSAFVSLLNFLSGVFSLHVDGSPLSAHVAFFTSGFMASQAYVDYGRWRLRRLEERDGLAEEVMEG